MSRFHRLPLAMVLLLLAVLDSSAQAQRPVWRLGRWNPDSFGNERVVLRVADTAQAIRALIPWRRRDADPADKRILLTDGSGRRIANTVALQVREDSGDVVFSPSAGAGEYYLYWEPYTGSVRSNYPRITYPRPDSTGDPAWVAAARRDASRLPRAEVIAFEAVDSMSQRWPMEVTATPGEVAALRSRFAGRALVPFGEDRTLPIKMTDALPERWVARADARDLTGTALRDEYYSFQVGVWGLQALDSLRVEFTGLSLPGAAPIPARAFNCITTDGVDWIGRPFHRRLSASAGSVTPIWCGVMVPPTARAGEWRGTARVLAAGGIRDSIAIRLRVANQAAINHGDDEPWRLSRLRWLDSRLAATGAPFAPYTPVVRRRDTLSILGRKLVLGSNGLPRQVSTSFEPGMMALSPRSRNILARPVSFEVLDSAGHPLRMVPRGIAWGQANASSVAFRSGLSGREVQAAVIGRFDFDGSLDYRVAVTTTRATPVGNIRLTLPFHRDVARYFMGLNEPGGAAPVSYTWRWDVKRNQDAVWIGDVNAGMQLSLRDEHYVRPLNTNFYQLQPLVMPRSWSNGGLGGCDFGGGAESGEYQATCFGGARTLTPGDTLWFDFRLLVTPFHPVDTRTHFATRYYHAYKPVDTVRAAGANMVNVHHATAINPYINYPFLRAPAMKAYADSVHAAGMRFKIYYTVRELTNRAPEFWALRSLGDEVFASGPGGGHSWLQEHVVSDYITGWVVPELRDIALVTSGISRWHNFYVEGLRWLTQHVGIDGIYLDDVAFDRSTMLRIRRVLMANGTPGEHIDLHSANQYNPSDGFASSANLYLEHFPFIDRLWFGEYFNYDADPGYWLVEMSGIPFGLMGEMLQGGGNPWRGMLFGMTPRLPWAGDPREEWRAWDAFGIVDSRMRGWWAPDTPVRTGRTDVLATTYLRRDRALVAVASWAKDTIPVTLQIDWKTLGLDPARVRVYAPEIPGYQPARSFRVGEPIPVPPGRGWLIRIDPL